MRVQEDEKFTGEYPKHWGCAMEVETADGRTLRTEVRDASGSVMNPLSPEQMAAKAENFIGIARPGREREVMRSVMELPKAGRLPRL